EAPRGHAQEALDGDTASTVTAEGIGAFSRQQTAAPYVQGVAKECILETNAQVFPAFAAQLQHQPRCEPIEAASHLATSRQASFDASPGPHDLTDALHNGRGGGFFLQVAISVRPELSHALQEIFLPG